MIALLNVLLLVGGAAAIDILGNIGARRVHNELRDIRRELGVVPEFYLRHLFETAEVIADAPGTSGQSAQTSVGQAQLGEIATIIGRAFNEYNDGAKVKSRAEFDQLYEELVVVPCEIVRNVYARYRNVCDNAEGGLSKLGGAARACSGVLENSSKRDEFYKRIGAQK